MNIYIGYKYRHNKDKNALKNSLMKISDALSSVGCSSFILERDTYNWCHDHSTPKSILSIFKNMKKADAFFAFVDTEVHSTGLLIESIAARLLGKKVVLALRKGLKGLPFKPFAHHIIEYETPEELYTAIPSSLKSLR